MLETECVGDNFKVFGPFWSATACQPFWAVSPTSLWASQTGPVWPFDPFDLETRNILGGRENGNYIAESFIVEISKNIAGNYAGKKTEIASLPSGQRFSQPTQLWNTKATIIHLFSEPDDLRRFWNRWKGRYGHSMVETNNVAYVIGIEHFMNLVIFTECGWSFSPWPRIFHFDGYEMSKTCSSWLCSDQILEIFIKHGLAWIYNETNVETSMIKIE